MSVFSVTTLDRFIEPASPSSSSKSAMERDGLYSAERKTPYLFYPPLYVTPSQQRPPSPSSCSPSPYIVNFKRRGSLKNLEVELKTSQQQNGFHISHKSTGEEDKSQEENTLPEAGITMSELKIEKFIINDNEKTKRSRILSGGANFEAVQHVTKLPEENLAEVPNQPAEGDVFEMEMVGNDCIVKQDSMIPSKQIDKSGLLMTGLKKLCWPLASIGQVKDRCRPASIQDSQTSSGEEFFDAPDAPLDDSASEDEATHIGSYISGGQRPGHKSSGRFICQLQEEISRRIRAEEALSTLQLQWDEMSRKFSALGLVLPPRPCEENGATEKDQGGADFYEEFVQRLVVARLVGGAVATGAVKAEKEKELEGVLASKNCEIVRLRDKLQYFELINHEMSQRNQEAIERAQRHRRRRRKRQQWAFGCIGAVLFIGTAAGLGYKFLPWDQARSWKMRLSSSACQANQHDARQFYGQDAL